MDNETAIKERIKVINKLALDVGHQLGYTRPTAKEVRYMICTIAEDMGIISNPDTIEFLATAHYLYVVNEGNEEVIQKLLARNNYVKIGDFRKTLEIIDAINKSSSVYCYDMPGENLVRLKKKIESGEPMSDVFKVLTEDELALFKDDVPATDLGSAVMNALGFYLCQYANDLRNRVKVVKFIKYKQLEPRGNYDMYVVPGYNLEVALEVYGNSGRYVVGELCYKEIEKSGFKGFPLIRNVYVRTDVHF